MRISDWSSDVCSSDLEVVQGDEWTTDIGTPEGEYEDGRKRHWIVASVNRRRDEWEANRQLIAAAVNLLRTHVPALLAALRLREWRPDRKSTRLNSSH